MAERGLQNLPAVGLDRLQEAVRRDLPYQDEEGRRPRLERRAQLLDIEIVDPYFPQRARHGLRRRARRDAQPKEPGREEHPDKRAPEVAPGSPGRGQVVRLLERDLPVPILHGHDSILDIDERRALQLGQRQPHLMCLGHVVVLDRDKISHLSFSSRLATDSSWALSATLSMYRHGRQNGSGVQIPSLLPLWSSPLAHFFRPAVLFFQYSVLERDLILCGQNIHAALR